MTRKKLKITIECEGQPTQVLEANGIAAALLTDGEDKNSHGLSVIVCGHMNTKDLLHLHDGVGEQLIDAVETNILNSVSPTDILKILMRRGKDESEG